MSENLRTAGDVEDLDGSPNADDDPVMAEIMDRAGRRGIVDLTTRALRSTVSWTGEGEGWRWPVARSAVSLTKAGVADRGPTPQDPKLIIGGVDSGRMDFRG